MYSTQRGFSLIELLIVLGLMATAATLALSTVGNKNNQNRFVETRGKLEIIRKAIVGENLTINQQTIINGFVADMGRLPNNHEELLTAPDDCNYETDSDTDGTFNNDNDQCPWTYDPESEIWHGWHGPYIFGISADFRDGWGKDWNWEWTPPPATQLTPDVPALAAVGTPDTLTISSFGLDADEDVDTNNLVGAELDYGDSELQQILLTGVTVTLPSAPLELRISNAPFCGQCRDNAFFGASSATEAACIAAADREWNSELEYCVETSVTTISASTCEAVGGTTWMPLFFGYCSDPTHINEVECSGATPPESWNNNNCSLYTADNPTTPAYDFTNGSVNFCARVIRIHHGQIVNETHNSTDATVFDITGGQSAIFNDAFPSCTNPDSTNCFSYQPEIEDNADVTGLILPHGVMRVGLYKYDTILNSCTTCPALINLFFCSLIITLEI